MVSWDEAGDGDFLAAGIAEEDRFVERENGIRHPAPLPARAFIGLIRAGEELARGLDGELQTAHGIGLHAFEILLHLAAFSPQGHARISSLVAQTPLSQSRVSRLVAGLEARGLVRRSTCADDSRGVEVRITEHGMQMLRQAQETHFAGLERRFLAKLSWDDLVQLARLTSKLRSDDP